jgi:SM-20-related protein
MLEALSGDSVAPAPALISRLADDIREQAYSVCNAALPAPLVAGLGEQLRASRDAFDRAGIGRQHDHHVNQAVRRDQICWIEGDTAIEQQWLHWTEALRLGLNRELLLGLFDFESHFAHYPPGAFYRRHLDSFTSQAALPRQEAQRVLSLVTYLNPDWNTADGGELLLYEGDSVVQRITPLAATLVCFLSTEVPHEVLPARRDRYSIAGWFRVNGSLGGLVDPPR